MEGKKMAKMNSINDTKPLDQNQIAQMRTLKSKSISPSTMS